MTQEEKAKAYDKVRKKIAIRFGSNVADEFFAEFEESEGERIRKAIIRYITLSTISTEGIVCDGVRTKDMLAWLEKQGEKDVRYKYLEDLLASDDIYQMARNDTMVEEAKNKAIEALSKLEISKLLKLEKQGEQKASYTTLVETGDGGINALVTRELPTDGEQKPEWSEEDEQFLYWTLNNLEELKQKYGAGYGKAGESIVWLNGIKQRIKKGE